MPAACAPAMSAVSLSPTITVVAASVPRASIAASKMRGEGLRHPISAEKVIEVEVAGEPDKGELCVERRNPVGRVRTQADAKSPAAQGIEERNRLRVEARAVPPGLLFDPQQLVEQGGIDAESGRRVGAEERGRRVHLLEGAGALILGDLTLHAVEDSTKRSR